MNRRKFLKAGFVLGIGIITSVKIKATTIITNVYETAVELKERIAAIILELKKEGSNLVKKIMNGKKYEYDPYVHYPYDGGIKDENSGYQFFYHIHRENEYGHFHTFATDEYGDLVHLVLISMNEKGEPIGLASVNRWVTGDKFVKADVLRKLAEKFYIEPGLFKDERIVEFVNYIFRAFKNEINELFAERDEWINNYVNTKFNEPFEDRDYEILSFKKINIKI
ncbi:MAG: hypothetical protein KGZ42_05810 [Melioribacter sp.]|nr:hypothetical protein [Melioribacter sp.]